MKTRKLRNESFNSEINGYEFCFKTKILIFDKSFDKHCVVESGAIEQFEFPSTLSSDDINGCHLCLCIISKDDIQIEGFSGFFCTIKSCEKVLE